MNEMTELWADYKRHQQEERAKRRGQAEQRLQRHGINYSVHNGGAHIVITEGGAIFDYWPGTERWRMRDHKGQFGFDKLVAAVRQRRVVAKDLSQLTGRAPDTDEAFVERMERAYPHIKGEE